MWFKQFIDYLCDFVKMNYLGNVLEFFFDYSDVFVKYGNYIVLINIFIWFYRKLGIVIFVNQRLVQFVEINFN